MIKQCQWRGTDNRGNIFCLPLLGKGLEKTAAVMQAQSRLHPRVAEFVGRTQQTDSGIYVLVNAMGAGEYWGSNINGDLFPEKALINSPPNWEQLPVDEMRAVGATWNYGYPTFMNAYPYKHHANKDPSRAFGRVEIAVWNPSMHRVELVVYLDRALCMQFDGYDIIQRIEQGGFPDVSMGCRVPFDVCTICGNQSKTRDDYCEHAGSMMNKILPDGRKVAVRNDTPRFFDISFVFIGADKTAKVMAKLAHKGNQVCLGEYCTIPRPSADVGAKYASPRDLMVDKLWNGLEKRKPGSWAKAFPDAPPLEKQASVKQRIVSGLIGGASGAGAGYIGNHAVKADKSSRKKDVVKDSIAGGILGAAFPFTKKASARLYVGNLQYDTTEKDVRDLLGNHGTVSYLKLPRDRETGRQRGFGVAEMSSEAEAEKVIKELHGRNFQDRALFVLKAKEHHLSYFPLTKKAEGSVRGTLMTNLGLLGIIAGLAHEKKREDAPHYGDVPPEDDVVPHKLRSALVGGTLGAALGYGISKLANDSLKKSYKVDGLDIGIEWPKGDTRKYKDGFSQKMKADYGYIKNTKDNDGEELDVYVGPNKSSEKVFVIKQLKDSGAFDEHKVMLGYDSADEAKKSYLAHMPAKKLGSLEEMTLAEFKKTNLKEAKELAKEAGESCSCACAGDECLSSIEKLAEAIFPGSKAKSASHRKMGELIKSVPAGPFTKETLPRLEQTEQDIPPEVLDSMADSGPAAAASTAGMMGIVLKPREFQRIMLVGMGDRGLADELDAKNMTFGPTQEVDESIPVDQGLSDERLQQLLQSSGAVRNRSIASPALQRRAQEARRPAGMPAPSTPARPDSPVMKKLAAAYNGYRRNLIKKAAQVERALTLNPQLRSDLFGASMAQAFAGGVEKTGFASVLGPDSLAYLVGAFHEDRGFHTADPGIVVPLAQVGGFAEMSV
jgi:hypothetical protein